MRASVNSICKKRFKEMYEAEKVNSKDKNGKCNNIDSRGCLYIIGIGPGGKDYFTIKAVDTLKQIDVVVCYKKYLKYVEDFINKDVKIVTTGMTKEVERGEKAIEYALKGKKVGVISTGDVGIYGMAGLIFELLENKGLLNKIEIEVIPGVSAFNAAASLLGAPIMHDFAVISLSDLLTPWELIEKRLKKAAEGDFVICIYNPKSKKRVEHFDKAIEIIKQKRDLNTPCGIVKNALRDNQVISITTLENAKNEEVDMNCVIIIGNSKTKIFDYQYIVTPRGYKI